jgi:hypothetical protein
MKPPRKRDDIAPVDPSRYETPGVPHDRRWGKAGDVGIGDVRRALNPIGELTEPGAEDDGDSRTAVAELFADTVCRTGDVGSVGVVGLDLLHSRLSRDFGKHSAHGAKSFTTDFHGLAQIEISNK